MAAKYTINGANSLYSLDPTPRVKITFHAEEDVEERSSKMFDSIRNDIFFVKLQQLAWEALTRNKTLMAEFTSKCNDANNINAAQGTIISLLEETGLKEVISNIAIRLYERNVVLHQQRSKFDATLSTARRSQDETIECIREARSAWEQGIKEELLTIVGEMNRPFTIVRPPGKLNDLLETNALQSVPRESVRFLFDSEDLLETGVSIRNPNMRSNHVERKLGLIKIALPVPSLQALIKRYAELSSHLTQLGLDETFLAWSNKLCHDRHEQGDAIASFGNAVDARQFLRRGCPPSLRQRLWRVALALGEDVSSAEDATYASLRDQCHSLDLLTDELFLHDVQNVTDDPRFFVFEEELKETVLCFARDEWVRENSMYEVHKPLLGMNNGGATGQSNPIGIASPPSAVQPFLGFAIYFAPLCYVCRDRVSIYSVLRQMWAKLWCKLNVLSGDEGTLLHVCATFESLLMTLHPRLFLHCLKIGIQPLQIALPWMQLGFVGLLEVDQVLHLWDRIMGYQDTLLLAVMAVSIFMLRAEAIMCSNVSSDVCIMLMEGSRLRVVPLLQLVLFSSSKPDN